MECPTCGSAAQLLDAAAVLGSARGASTYAWACAQWPVCDTYVACWRDTTVPVGSLADRETHEARAAAHTAFYRLWIKGWARGDLSKAEARRAGYRWLAAELGRARRGCHISWLDAETCREVIALCDAARRQRAADRERNRGVAALLAQVA
jgi:hypothetical protein